MKAIKLLIALCVLLTAFLVGGTTLANETRVFESATSDSNLEAPKLTITIDGNQVTLSWSKVTGATSYLVHYAQYPYDNPDTMKTIDVGDKTSAEYELSPGCAFHVAVKACKDSSSDCSDYSNIHQFVIPPGATFMNSFGQKFKLISAGTFMMGSPPEEPGRDTDEAQHQVTLTQPFYMQNTEVTSDQWMAIFPDSYCPQPCIGHLPIRDVSWNEVQSYIAKMNAIGEGTYSLPTEAQWEYAARSGSTTGFYNGHITQPDGDDPNLDTIGWYTANASWQVWGCAHRDPNVWGLYDMSGNVSEWVQDWYDDYPSSAVTDPTGPSSGLGRVLRGGDWNDDARSCRSANRDVMPPDYSSWDLGFRLVRQP